MGVVEYELVRRQAREMRARSHFQRRRAKVAMQQARQQQAAFLRIWLRATGDGPDLAPRRKAAAELRALLRSLAEDEFALASPKMRTMARVGVRALRTYYAGLSRTRPPADG